MRTVHVRLLRFARNDSMILLLIFVLPFLSGFSFFSAIKNEQGNKLYKKGQVGRAKSAYAGALKSDPDSPEIAFNLGNAYYREEAFADSESRYQKASREHKKPLLQSKAFYNLGNSAVRRSQTDKAVEHYKQALRLNPADQDAKYNLELLTKRQDQKQDNQKKDQQKNEQNQKQDQNQQSGQGGQGEQGEQGAQGAKSEQDKQKENQEKENQSGPESSQKDEPQEGQSAGQEAGKEERREEEERPAQEEEKDQPQEEEKDQPQEKRSQAQITADQILEALENQEGQVLMSRSSDKGDRREQVKKYVEKDW